MATRIYYSLDSDSRGVIHEQGDSGQAWNQADTALDAFDQDWADYYLTPADLRAGHTVRYITIPSSLPAGLYYLRIYAGATPLETAMPASVIAFNWDGTKLATGSGSPVSQASVPDSRTFKLVRKTTGGLVGEASRQMQIGENLLFAFDFYNDLPTNGRVQSFDAIAIKTGTAGGVTFDTANMDRDKTQAKVKIAGVTAGTYVLNLQVTYESGDSVEADVTLVVNT